MCTITYEYLIITKAPHRIVFLGIVPHMGIVLLIQAIFLMILNK